MAKKNHADFIVREGVKYYHTYYFARKFEVSGKGLHTLHCELNKKARSGALSPKKRAMLDCFAKEEGALFVREDFMEIWKNKDSKEELERAYYDAIDLFKNEHRLAKAVAEKIQNGARGTRFKDKKHALKRIYAYFWYFRWTDNSFNKVLAKTLREIKAEYELVG